MLRLSSVTTGGDEASSVSNDDTGVGEFPKQAISRETYQVFPQTRTNNPLKRGVEDCLSR
jgi:hypothetical protein